MNFHFSIILLIVSLLNKVWSCKIEENKLDIKYWNSNIGNMESVEIKFGKESSIFDNWIDDLPLKVITHGWFASDNFGQGVFEIRKPYIDRGGYNVITVDWSLYAWDINYLESASLTTSVGLIIAEFLERLVKVTGINPSNIHLIGHSLGAHVVGSCGAHFRSGKIGRITGLDPAAPAFTTFAKLNRILNKNDAEFVDVIHTSNFFGLTNPIGHADFYPNGGVSPQPGCSFVPKLDGLVSNICSHVISFIYYSISIKDEMFAMATKCDSWDHFKSNKCSNNEIIPMGHKTNSSARGNFYLETSVLYNMKYATQLIDNIKDYFINKE